MFLRSHGAEAPKAIFGSLRGLGFQDVANRFSTDLHVLLVHVQVEKHLNVCKIAQVIDDVLTLFLGLPMSA